MARYSRSSHPGVFAELDKMGAHGVEEFELAESHVEAEMASVERHHPVRHKSGKPKLSDEHKHDIAVAQLGWLKHVTPLVAAAKLSGDAPPSPAPIVAPAVPVEKAKLPLSVRYQISAAWWVEHAAQIAVVLLLLFLAVRAHAQVDIVGIQQAGITVKQWAGGKAFLNFPSNMTCSFNAGTKAVDCTPSGAVGSVAWDAITAAGGNFSLAHAARTTTFTWGAATGAGINMFNLTDTLNNTGTGFILNLNLASGSAAKPFFAGVNGVGVAVSNAGVLAASGGGHVNADQCNGATCGTVTSLATSSPLGGGTITGSGTLTCTTCATTTNGGALSGTAPVTVSAAGAIGCATCLTGNQTITLSGDVTGSGTTAITAVNVNLPDGVSQAGSLLHTNIAAPASPAAGKVKSYTDSTDLRFHDKNENGIIGTTAVAKTAASHKFFNALSGAGVLTDTQPAEADLSVTDITTNNVTSTSHGFVPKSPADATQFLNGAATPAFAAVKDSDLSTSDITTNNVSITKHGFAPKAPNDATKYLDGTGAYSVPAGGSGASFTTANQGDLWFPTLGHPYSSTASAAVASANRVMVIAMSLPASYKFSKLLYNISTTAASTHCDFGWYDASGNLSVHTGSIDSSTNAKSQAAVAAATISGFGYYAWSCDATTVQFTSILDTNQSTVANGDGSNPKYARCANAASAGVLPATCGALTADATANPPMTIAVP